MINRFLEDFKSISGRITIDGPLAEYRAFGEMLKALLAENSRKMVPVINRWVLSSRASRPVLDGERHVAVAAKAKECLRAIHAIQADYSQIGLSEEDTDCLANLSIAFFMAVLKQPGIITAASPAELAGLQDLAASLVSNKKPIHHYAHELLR